MIKRLRRLLGWDSNVARPPSRPVYIMPPAADQPSSAAPARRAARTAANRSPRTGKARSDSHATRQPAAESKQEKGTLADLLAEDLELDDDPFGLFENPELSLDTSADGGFDPYNTGAFDRSSSWDRISKARKR